MMNTLINTKGYAFFKGLRNPRPRHKLEVTFILDMVPGTFHTHEDLMRWIGENPYVDTVIYKGEVE
jgi:hypothetical protein